MILFLTYLKHLLQNSSVNNIHLYSSDSMTYVWGVAFGKDIGAEKTPRSNSARCISTFYAFFALIVVNTYCANLMAFLVQEHFQLPISGIRDSKVIRYFDISHSLCTNCSWKLCQFGGK